MLELHLIHSEPNHLAPEGPVADITIDAFPRVLGRAGVDHCLHYPMISRRHCGFFLHGGRVFVEDLGSLNGTFLNGTRVTEARPVADGDWLQLAHLSFEARLSPSLSNEDLPPRTMANAVRH